MIADSLLRISVVLLAGLAIRGGLARHSAAVRHGVVTLTLLCALLVIPAAFVLPAWTFAVPAGASLASEPPPHDSPAVLTLTTETTATVQPASRPAFAPALWASGFLAVIGVLVAGIVRLRQIAARGTRVDAHPPCSAAACRGRRGNE